MPTIDPINEIKDMLRNLSVQEQIAIQEWINKQIVINNRIAELQRRLNGVTYNNQNEAQQVHTH